MERQEIKRFPGADWKRLTERSGESWERPLSCSGLIMAYDEESEMEGNEDEVRGERVEME